MKNKVLGLGLCFAMITTMLAGCANTSTQTQATNVTNDQVVSQGEVAENSEVDFTEEPYEVVMKIYNTGDLPKDMANVMESVNEILLRDLNMTLDLEIMDKDTYNQQLPLLLSSGEKIDIALTTGGNLASFDGEGELTDIAPYLQTEDGKKIVESFGGNEAMTQVCSIGNKILGVPLHKDTIYTQTIMARTDMIEKYQIDTEGIHTLEDINTMFEKVAAGEPNMWMIATSTSHGSNSLVMMDNFDGLGDGYGVLMDPFESTTVSNLWESDEFMDFCSWMRKWYNNGWINPAAATDTESYYTYIKTGQAFCMFRRYGHPLAESDCETNTNGVDLTAIHVLDPIMSSSTAKDVCYIIPYTSEQPEKAFKMISYMMNSKEINDLLNWGIEGEDWVKNADGCADYPEGKDYDSVAYHFDGGWALPNQFLCTVWNGKPADIYQQMDAYNNQATSSLALGFNYDNTAVADQVAKVKAIESKYLVALMTGSVDPEEYIPMMIQESKEAGVDDIIAEKQKQLDAWLASK